ncbi:pentapeptide repeat-containing protein [Streptomyces sp. RS2]|uniref:pentapeptide repeat-containing protein n=1 Tax=Streptomyces sp. RS2 TaxID=1451205 RepID=UPI0021F8E389|nr:pentapeptide repeat-containing protein [Streptomyces sp. RS2]MCW1100213.1 pentapeptide repeat-containing protein [Streptomyces sp. RS2]
MKPHFRRLVVTVAGALAAFAYVLLLWRGPWWVDGPHLRDKELQPADGVIITGFRTMLVALGAGAVAALGLYYTHRTHRHAEKLYEHSLEQFAHVREKDREQAALTREGQVTEQYVEAIKLLGSGNLHERLGGIYSLERIMKDSERDHRTVVEVLSAFVRTPAPNRGSPGRGSAEAADEESGESAELVIPDVMAALAVLGRQPTGRGHLVTDLRGSQLTGAVIRDVNLCYANLQRVELTGARLDDVMLTGAHLAAATLTGAVLLDGDLSDVIAPTSDFTGVSVVGTRFTNAVLTDTTLVGADFSHVDFSHASMVRADLKGAFLMKAVLRYSRLEHADLRGARLEGADLTEADLVGACLAEADLTGAVLGGANLAHADLAGADLAAADLGSARWLAVRQLVTARITRDTRLPARLAADLKVRERIAVCEAADQEGSRA